MVDWLDEDMSSTSAICSLVKMSTEELCRNKRLCVRNTTCLLCMLDITHHTPRECARIHAHARIAPFELLGNLKLLCCYEQWSATMSVTRHICF